MKFRYRKTPDDTDPSKRWIARPILQVRLYYGRNHQDIHCLVDSGADDCLFHTSVGEVLGIDVQAGRMKRFAGIAAGHSVDAYMHAIQMQIQGFSDKIDIEAAFTDSDWVSGILGQSGFFDNYRVTFERFRGRFEVTSRARLRLSNISLVHRQDLEEYGIRESFCFGLARSFDSIQPATHYRLSLTRFMDGNPLILVLSKLLNEGDFGLLRHKLLNLAVEG